MACFNDELADMLFYERPDETMEQTAARFNRDRKALYLWMNGGSFRLSLDFLQGLWSLGYDMAIVQTRPAEFPEGRRIVARYTDAVLSGEIPPANAMDKLAVIIREAQLKEGAAKTAQRFNRERKAVYQWIYGCAITIDRDFIAGLWSLGYELHLKKERPHIQQPTKALGYEAI